MSTSVVWHPACRLHQAGAGHPERPERIAAVLEALRAPELTPQVVWTEAVPAGRAALERVHPAAYLDGLAALAGRGGGALDPDTYLGARSWDGALASAGVAIGAVDAALARTGGGGGGPASGGARPPGHPPFPPPAWGFCSLTNLPVPAPPPKAAGWAPCLMRP